MKKTLLFILCAAAAVSAFAFPGYPPKAAEAASEDTRNIFQYDFYQGSGYYEINYYLDIYKDTAEEIDNKCGSGSTKELLNSIEQFFYAYESLFFNDTSESHIKRYTAVEAFDAYYNPYYSLNMYISFQSDEKKSAGEKYGYYFGYGEGEDIEPTKESFFANRYERQDVTHFFVPSGLEDYSEFRSRNYFYDDYGGFSGLQKMAALNAVMMPFLLYGNVRNTGFADLNKTIDYQGLVNINSFKNYFGDKFPDGNITKSSFFSNYILYHTMSVSTAYFESDADEKTSSMGEYMHIWEASYTDRKYDANRIINYTYVEPQIINMYFLAMGVAAGFVALLLLCFYGIPKLRNREKISG